MALRTAAGLLFVFLLRFGGVRSETVHIHHFSRAGENSTLPCERLSHHGPSCSVVNWNYYKTRSPPIIPKVSEGNVKDSRLTLNPDCSLSVQKVSKEDSGLFLCRQTGVRGSDTNVYLSVLTVSPAPPEPKSPNFTLHCKLWRFNELPCSAGTLVWVDQNQEVLSGEQRNCESELTVELQSPQTRTFTCQYQENGRVQVSAEYSLRGEEERVQPEKGEMIYIISGAVGGVLLLLLLVAAAVLFYKIKSKSSPQMTEHIYMDPQPADSVVDPENNLTYAMINHQKPKAKNQIVVEDAVTYSAVAIKPKDSSCSAVYSTVNKT